MLQSVSKALRTAWSIRTASAAGARPKLITDFHTQRLPASHKPTHYYHLNEGCGGLHTFPEPFQTPGGVHQDLTAIGTDNCNTCACIYIPLTSTQCFAAHIKAWLHTSDGDSHDTWCPGPANGEILTQLIINKLEGTIEPALLEADAEERSRRSIVVCPWQVFCGEKATGSYILDGVQRFFKLGDEVREQHILEIKRPHGFGVDHLGGERQLLMREKFLSMYGWRQRHPEEYGWVRANPTRPGQEKSPGEWCFVYHEGRWKPFREYKQDRGARQSSLPWWLR